MTLIIKSTKTKQEVPFVKLEDPYLTPADLAIFSSASITCQNDIEELCESYRQAMVFPAGSYMGRLVKRLRLNEKLPCGTFLKKVNELATIVKEPSLMYAIPFPNNLQGLLSAEATKKLRELNVHFIKYTLDAEKEFAKPAKKIKSLFYGSHIVKDIKKIEHQLSNTGNLLQKRELLKQWWRRYGPILSLPSTKGIENEPTTSMIPPGFAHMRGTIIFKGDVRRALMKKAVEQRNLQYVREAIYAHRLRQSQGVVDSEESPGRLLLEFRNKMDDSYVDAPGTEEYFALIDKILLTQAKDDLSIDDLGDILASAAETGNGKNVKLCLEHPLAHQLSPYDLQEARNAAKESGFQRVEIVLENALNKMERENL